MDRYQKLLTEKAKKKRELMGNMFFPRKPIVMLDLSASKRVREYKDLLAGLDAINVITLVVLNKKHATTLPEGKNIRYLSTDSMAAAQAAADFVVVSEGDPSIAWKNGCVPISKLDGERTLDYNPLQEKGNGFYFKNPTKWEVFAAIVRAIETYQFPYDWENLMREIINL